MTSEMTQLQPSSSWKTAMSAVQGCCCSSVREDFPAWRCNERKEGKKRRKLDEGKGVLKENEIQFERRKQRQTLLEFKDDHQTQWKTTYWRRAIEDSHNNLNIVKINGLIPVIFLITLLLPSRLEAIRCYCTDEHCVPYGVCESNVCLVGVLKETNAVIRTCGNQPLGCQRNVDRWNYICSCDENFCNTFLFLKASTSIDGHKGSSEGSRVNPGDHRIFERVDPPPGEFATFDHSSDEGPAPIKNSNLLTLLLVIVPLSVGAAATLVVAINYYCHLC